MRLARRALLASALASAAAPAVLRLARADGPQVTLKLHHFFSAVSSGHEKFLVPWARKIEAESGHSIRIDIFPSMQLGGAPAQLFDQARDGVADIVWAVPGNTPGRFAKAETFELPFLASHRALVNSKAVESFAAVNLQDEFREVHPICFSCRDHGVVHASRAVRSVADLKGLRLHVPNRLAGESVQALGAQGVAVPIPQLFLAVSTDAIDGCLDPWDLLPSSRLGDILKFHTDFAKSSLSNSVFVLAMNKATYDRLPRDLKKVIDANAGSDTAGLAGAMWDLEARAVAERVRGRGDDVTMLTAQEVAQWRKMTEPVIGTWLRQMKERKIDGGKLIAQAYALLAKYQNEPEPAVPQPPSQPSEQKIVTEPSQPPQQQRLPQAKAEIAAPKVETPAAPTLTRAPPKELDIPM